MEPSELRAAFPVLDRVAYLNAGTDGPVPRAGVEAAARESERELLEGRWGAHFDRVDELRGALRAGYASLLGADSSEVALTGSTSEGVGLVVAGLGLVPGDEILTARDEHPGLLGPLRAAREMLAVDVREVELEHLADEVSRRTRLVACSHVSWINGALAPEALAGVDDVPVLLDGAQGVGAVAVNPETLGCDFYAASGQKWLCGPDGSGFLWISPRVAAELTPTAPSYRSFSDPYAGLDAPLHTDARRHDSPVLAASAMVWSLAALELLAAFGWPAIHERARGLAADLALRLAAAGRSVQPRGASTLVSWHSEDSAADRDKLAAAGVVVRDLPGHGLVRASVGAWNDESDLERLLEAL